MALYKVGLTAEPLVITDYFDGQTLPTYDWLANQGITPSSTATYSLSKVIAALETESGVSSKKSLKTFSLTTYIYFRRASHPPWTAMGVA